MIVFYSVLSVFIIPRTMCSLNGLPPCRASNVATFKIVKKPRSEDQFRPHPNIWIGSERIYNIRDSDLILKFGYR